VPEEIDQIRSNGPGRFATRVDAYVFELGQAGLNDEFTATDGSWLGLLKADGTAPLYDPMVPVKTELNEAERRFLLAKAGVIMEEDREKAFTVDYFERAEELDDAWRALQDTRAEVALESDMDQDQPEIPEGTPPVEITAQMLAEAQADGKEDAQRGAGRGSTPSLARLDRWASAYGYLPETHGQELGLLTDAWRRGVYLQTTGGDS
jgi:hypothetical protein